MNELSGLLINLSANEEYLLIFIFIISFGKSAIFICSFLPPATITLLAVISLALPIVNAWAIWLAITLGATMGSILMYHTGNLIKRKDALLKLNPQHIEIINRTEKYLLKNTLWILFSSRFIAVLRYFVPLTAGILCLDKIMVYGFSFFSSATWAVLLIFIVNIGAEIFLFPPGS